MRSKLISYLENDFLRHNLVFFIGSIIVAALNYAYHPIMSRMLSVEDFGEVQVLFSILGLVGVPLGIFNIVALNLYTNNNSYSSPAVQQFSLLAAYVAGVTALILIVSAPYIASLLQLSTAFELVIIAGAIIISSITIFGKAYLQATHRFGITSIANAIGAGGKLIAAIILVSLGFTVTGAVGGLFIASFLSFCYVVFHARQYSALPKLQQLAFTPELKQELRFGFIVLCGTGLIMFLTLSDVIFAKYLFTPEIAGLYAGISVVGRVILFLTASITGVLLTHVKLSAPASDNRTFLRQGLILTALISGGALVMFALFPAFIVSLLVGSDYIVFAHLLPLLSLYVFLITLINVCVTYGLALRQKSVITIGIFGILSTIIFVSVLPSTPDGLINGFLYSSVLTLMFCLYIQFVKPKISPHHVANISQLT